MTIQTVTDAIRYVGVDDNTLALFENQYPVQPMGVSYNSYVILGEKIAVMDSVDARAAEEWLSNVARVLEGRSPDYLVVTHMEPDHSGSLMRLAQKYPEMKIVGNAKTFTLIKQFFGTGALSEDRMLEVGERDTLSLGLHRLRFLLAPMVHWPEVMAAYEEEEKILFSADAFGRFGSLERTARAPWAPQARRYYYNIVGKYGAQVQALLKKISALEIKTICPLHGPMLTEDMGEYLRLYDLWSQWKPEKPEGILIAHASIHGNTAYDLYQCELLPRTRTCRLCIQMPVSFPAHGPAQGSQRPPAKRTVSGDRQDLSSASFSGSALCAQALQSFQSR